MIIISFGIVCDFVNFTITRIIFFWESFDGKYGFKIGELGEKVLCAEIAHNTQHDAVESKSQTKVAKYYNLDASISVGYRVNSQKETKFRI